MITRVEALNYKCLRHLSRPLRNFQVLVGPNASGKSTFLDVVNFLGDLVYEGLDFAVEKRGDSLSELFWMRTGTSFQLAVEFMIPESLRSTGDSTPHGGARYEVEISGGNGDRRISEERLWLLGAVGESIPGPSGRQSEFPSFCAAPSTLFHTDRAWRRVVAKARGGNDNYYSEKGASAPKGWNPSFKLGPKKSALANLPDDEEKFPVASWVKRVLSTGIRTFTLDSLELRKPSSPEKKRGFETDGSNLPWVVHQLERDDPERLSEWVAHLRTALPELTGIRTREIEYNKTRYVEVEYETGLCVPSWHVSDGTLRLLALTLPAYAREMEGVFLIEEPENGIHPRAVETMYRSLSSVYGAQVLLATHSPVILNMANARDVLCFAKTPEGATDIVTGDRHPGLADWTGGVPLGVLFASGVLG